jgi:hypothetical protein
MDGEFKERIDSSKQFMMLYVATLIWLVGLIPFADWITDPLQWAIFWLWFKMSGASLSQNKVKNIVSAIVTMVPTLGAFLGAFPIVIYLNIRSIRAEDKIKQKQADTDLEQEQSEKIQEIQNQNQQNQVQSTRIARASLNTQQNSQQEPVIIDRNAYSTEQYREPTKLKVNWSEENGSGMRGANAYTELEEKQNRDKQEDAMLARAEVIRKTGRIQIDEQGIPLFEDALAQYTKDTTSAGSYKRAA